MGRYTALLGEAYLLTGRLSEARSLLLSGLERMETGGYGLGIARARRFLGHLALAEGSPQAACGLFERALVVAATSETYYEEARARLDLATLIGRSDLARAEQLARQALDFFTAARAGVWEARARALLEGRDPRAVAGRS